MLSDIQEDAKKVRPYDHVWDMYYDEFEDAEEQVDECRQYTVEEIFCCAYAPYFWQAIQIRYPEYATYNHKLYALLGGTD